MQFHTQFQDKEIPFKFDEGGGPCEVETAGYIPAQKQIENMIAAGRRLQDYRREQFDFNPGEEIDEDFYDPTRNKNFDMADGFQMQENIINSMRAKASQTAQKQRTDVLDKKTSDSMDEVQKKAVEP